MTFPVPNPTQSTFCNAFISTLARQIGPILKHLRPIPQLATGVHIIRIDALKLVLLKTRHHTRLIRHQRLRDLDALWQVACYVGCDFDVCAGGVVLCDVGGGRVTGVVVETVLEVIDSKEVFP